MGKHTTDKLCPTCGGKGTVSTTQDGNKKNSGQTEVPCPTCR